MAAPMRRFVFLKRFKDTCFFHATCGLKKETLRKSQGKTSSNKWLTRQINDPFVTKAREQGFRCRSAFKLLEIDKRFKLLKPGDNVIDCGAAPGSWSQVAVQKIKAAGDSRDDCNRLNHGMVIAVDLQCIEPIEGITTFSNHDFTLSETQTKVLQALENRLANVVLSDMAPPASSSNELDHDKICELCISVLKFSSQVIQEGGHVVCKLWDGKDRDKIVSVFKRMFTDVKIVKPEASRSESAEIFIVGMNYFLR